MKFQDLKVGDRVNRYMGKDVFFMEMEVVNVTDDLIECAAVNKSSDGKELGLFKGGWHFNRRLGCEEDADLQWGEKFGHTGTYLKLKEDLPKVSSASHYSG